MKQKINTLLASLALFLCSITMSAQTFDVDGITYTVYNENEVYVSSGSQYEGDLIIPESVAYSGNDYKVTSIGDEAFNGYFSLTSVTIPNSVTSIGYDAFNNCFGLTSVHISDIAAWCNIDFGSIESNPLYYADHLYLNEEEIKELVIPNSVTSIGDYAFCNCTGLTSVTIPNNVTSIGYDAFKNCSGLTSVHISDIAAWCNIDFGSIESNPLYYADHLYLNEEEIKELVIPNSVTSIGDYAFCNCTGLTSVTIPNSVTSIGGWAFYGCSGLTSVTIPNSVTSIGHSAFSDCYGLTSVTIPNSVTSIGDYAFDGCSGLISVHISDIAAWCNIDFVDSGSNPLFYAHHLYVNGEEIKELVIPNSVTSIGEYAFRGCTGLTSVTIPNSVTSIGDYAFDRCSGLTSVTIPNSVTSIGYAAFWGCSGLTSVTIPNSVTSIGKSAFFGCSGLTSVTIPNSVTSIDENAFRDCSNLSTIVNFSQLVFETGSDDYGHIAYYATHVINAPNGSIEGDYVFAVIEDINTLCGYLGNDTELTLPANYKGQNYQIGSEAFEGYSSLTSVTIPNSVTSIGDYAFSGCSDLTSVTIGNSVTSIGDDAFRSCSGLASVTIGNSVTNIGKNAFRSCSGLASVTIGNSVTNIGKNAFRSCSGLTLVTIGNSVTSIGYDAFYNCTNLKYVVNLSNLPFTKGDNGYGCIALYADKLINVPGGTIEGDFVFSVIDGKNTLCVYIGDDTELTLPENYKEENYVIGSDAFEGYSALTSVIIPNSVTSIGDYAFSSCSGLTSVTIGNSVTSIGVHAFSGCSGLTSVTIPNSVTSIGGSAFSVCSGLTTVTIGNCVTSIGNNAFYNCTNLKYVVNLSNLPFTKGDKGYGCIALYADELINIPDGTIEGDFVFGVIDGKNTLCRYIGDETDLILPASYKGGNYIIGSYAFYNCSGLTSVTIPNSVTSIGRAAFEGCSGLTSVTIPNSVTSIGRSAFYGCSSLPVENGIRYADSYLVGVTDNNLSTYIIQDGTRFIGSYAFFGCSGLTSITIPNSVTSIGDDAFYNCSGLTSVTIPNSVTSIGNNAFLNCTALTAVYINSLESWCNIEFGEHYASPTIYAKKIFLNGELLTDLVIPDGIVKISTSAFDCCSYLKSVIVPNSVTEIGFHAFYDCKSLKTIYNLSELELRVGSSEYGGIAQYANTVINSPNGTIEDGYIFGIIDSTCTMHKYIGDKTELVLPKDYKGHNYQIASSAFKDCSALTSVTIPNGVMRIGDDAFSGCSALASISIPGSVTYIGENAFRDCNSLPVEDNIRYADSYLIGIADKNLSSYTIKEGTRFIGTSAFSNCSSLNSITIPNSITQISSSAFIGCTGLGSVNINSLEAWCNIDFGNIEANPVAYAKQLFLDWDLVTDLTIPDGITEIHKHAFNSCESLVSVTIPNSVTSIGSDAFANCKALELITIGNNVKDISGWAFVNCTNLKTVINFSELTFTTGSGAYGNIALNANIVINAPNASILDGYVFSVINGKNTLCRYIGDKTELVLPETYNNQSYEIGSSAFENLPKIVSVVIPDSVSQIGANAFKDCSALLSVSIGNAVTAIEDNAFKGCAALTSVVIPDCVSKIGTNAFNACSALTFVCIGNGVTTIGDNAFSNCEVLEKVYLNAKKEPSASKNVFDGSHIELATLYVPKGTLKKYSVIAPWSGFGEIAEYTPAFTITYILDGVEFKKESWEVGTKIETPQAPEKEGHTFNGWENVPETMPANDIVIEGNYSVNKYLLTFKIEGEVISSEYVEYGAKIETPQAPEKEGHTFNGWEDVPETMPANDIVIEGSYSVNKYLLTFKIEGEVISSEYVEYGAKVETPQAPEKEGHTFNGWENVPETMPAMDIVLYGSYTVNIYKVYYYVGEELVHTDEVAYGESIPAYEYIPTNGDKFMGWDGEKYDTMPAHDVTYTANIVSSILYINGDMSDYTIYDLNGRIIENINNLKNGVYIVNGKMTIVKVN